nr:hypothetical protein Iba_chr14dCG5220 [Ipomoea batatas]
MTNNAPLFLLIIHAHQRGEENNLVVLESRRNVHDIRGVEKHPGREARMGAHQAGGQGVGNGVNVVVVEVGVGEVIHGEDYGGEKVKVLEWVFKAEQSLDTSMGA